MAKGQASSRPGGQLASDRSSVVFSPPGRRHPASGFLSTLELC